MSIKEEEFLIWLSMIKDMNYYLMLKLLKAYNSLEELYNSTKNSEFFNQILVQNNLYIPQELFFSLVDKEFKIKAKQIYLNLISQNLKIISIFSNVYPKELKNSINAPLVLVIYGNTQLLYSKKKKVYLYNEVKNDNKLNILENEVFKNTNVLHVNENIQIISNNNLFTEYFKIQNLDSKKIYIFVQNPDIVTDVISAISDVLFVVRASFNEYIFKISTLMLEMGKDILVVPGEIYKKETYFSNYLLREGAIVILSRKDINYYLNSI